MFNKTLIEAAQQARNANNYTVYDYLYEVAYNRSHFDPLECWCAIDLDETSTPVVENELPNPGDDLIPDLSRADQLTVVNAIRAALLAEWRSLE